MMLSVWQLIEINNARGKECGAAYTAKLASVECHIAAQQLRSVASEQVNRQFAAIQIMFIVYVHLIKSPSALQSVLNV